MGQCPAIRVGPVIDPEDTRQISFRDFPAVDPFPVREHYSDMLQDILTVREDPGEDILDHPVLAPPPLLAASAAL
jgi:hypothetical protein